MMSLEARGQGQVDSILNFEDINWSGSKHHLRPVPIVDRQAYDNIVERLEALDKTHEPAPKIALAGLLYKLQGHYWQPNMSEQLAREVANDYVRLLDGYSIDVMQRACDRWLMNKENKFFPKVGELKDVLDSVVQRKKWYEMRLRILASKYLENYKDAD